MVRLITHNLLACHSKACAGISFVNHSADNSDAMDADSAPPTGPATNFPLKFRDAKIELREAEFNEDFLKGFLPRIEWKALVDSARDVSSSSPVCEYIF